MVSPLALDTPVSPAALCDGIPDPIAQIDSNYLRVLHRERTGVYILYPCDARDIKRAPGGLEIHPVP